MLERILVPLDGSERADRILRNLGGVLSHSDVTLLRVVPSTILSQEHPPEQNPLTVARRYLAARRDELVGRGVSAHARLEVADDAAAKILDFAREHATTLIAMSTHGRTGAARLVRGSIAERVLRHAQVPVLLASPLALAGDEELRFRRILVPLDGSERSAEVIPQVIELARRHGSEVILNYSIPVDVALEPWMAAGPLMTREQGEKLLEQFHARFYDIPVRRLVTLGDPATNVIDLVESEKVDLVAMTTHGRSGPSRWLLGSVTEQVTRHARCPLLVVRNAAPAATQPRAETATTAR